MSDLDRNLAVYGSDLSRWPARVAQARQALLANKEFRGAWERERDFDRQLEAERGKLDAEIAGSGALVRLTSLAAPRASAGFLADISWRRVAAGVLFAGMLGGAIDFLLPVHGAEAIEMALVDPLVGIDAESR